jgi:hypothetical protein
MLNALPMLYAKFKWLIEIHILTLKTKPVVAILVPIMNNVPIKIAVAANTCAYR